MKVIKITDKAFAIFQEIASTEFDPFCAQAGKKYADLREELEHLEDLTSDGK